MAVPYLGGEWGVGSGGIVLKVAPYSLPPTPHSFEHSQLKQNHIQ
jgi:hypothetical protein